MNLKKIIVEYLEGRNTSRLLGGVLFFFSMFYFVGIAVRNFLYDLSFFRIHRFSVPIISIGNIVAGGTGKTPFVLYLARELSKTKKVAILTRGYLSKLEKEKVSTCINALENPLPEVVGDEPYLYLHHLPFVDIWVGRDRIFSAREAIKKGAEILLLDDGMQFRLLHRDVEIAVVDAKDPLGGSYYLPRGYLRDFPSRLKKADMVLVNHVESLECYSLLEKEIKTLTKAPIVAAHFVRKKRPLPKKVGVFCGIGKPKHFIESLEKEGLEMVDILLSADHEIPPNERLELFAKACQNAGAEALLCTEKDFVKIAKNVKTCIPIVCVEIELELIIGKKFVDTIIERFK